MVSKFSQERMYYKHPFYVMKQKYNIKSVQKMTILWNLHINNLLKKEPFNPGSFFLFYLDKFYKHQELKQSQ